MFAIKKSLLQYFEINEKRYSLGDKKVKFLIPESRKRYEGVPEHLLLLLHKFNIDKSIILKFLK